MADKGIRVDIARDRSIEGNFMGITEVNGKKFGIVDTHADPTKGVRYVGAGLKPCKSTGIKTSKGIH